MTSWIFLISNHFCSSLLVKITKSSSVNVILIGENCIQIFFQQTVTLIYTTTKPVSFMTSQFGSHNRFKSKVTSRKHAWNMTAKLMMFTFTYFYLFISGLFLFYYYWFYLVILLSAFIILYQVIFFVHSYITSSQIQIFTGYIPTTVKRSQTKQVVKSHILCNFVLKENSNKAFPNSRCCSVIILFCFNKKNFVKDATVHGLYAPTTM